MTGPGTRVVSQDTWKPIHHASKALTNGCDFHTGGDSNYWGGHSRRQNQSFVLERCHAAPITKILLRNSRSAQYNDG